MAAPSDMTTQDMSGTFVMNKDLSDDTDRILEKQGVGWFKRTAIRLATITLYVNHYHKDGVEHIDVKQTLTGGIEGTEENRTIDWVERKHVDKLFGAVVSKSRRIKAEEIENEFLSTGWLPEAVESGLIHSYVVSDKPEGSKGYWVAEQTWGFEIINEQKRHVRHVYFTSEGEIIRAKLIYDYAAVIVLAVMNFVREHLPPWITNNLNPSSYKLLFRSWLSAWACFLLLLPDRSLRTFGNGAFFACMAVMFVPPAFPAQIFLFAIGLLLLGGLIGWAWGCAAMKAALTARSKVLLLSQIERVNRTTASSANPDAAFQIEIFKGEFLDVGSSVVFGVFLAVGAFCFAVVRGTSPRLTPFSMIGSIFLNIMCSFGPLFPAVNYTLAQSFITSLTASMAISSITIILVFPETLNYVALKGTIGLLTTIRRLLEIQEKVLKTKTSEELKEGSSLASQIQSMLGGVFAGMEKLSSNAKMLSLEFSYGRVKGEDIQSLLEPLTVLVARISGLQNFSRLVVGDYESTMQRQIRTKNKDKSDKSDGQIPTSNISSETPLDADGFILHHLEEDNTVHQEEIFPLIYTATADLRQSCVNSLNAIIDILERINDYRWSKAPGSDPNLNTKIEELRVSAEEFKTVRRLSVMEPFKQFVAPSHSLSNEASRKMLFIAFTYEANLIWLADSILELLDVISELASRHPSPRLWAPKGLRSLWKIIFVDRDDADVSDDNDDPVDPVTIERRDVKYRHDPDSEPPENIFQRIGDAVYRSYNWCKTPRAIFAFKYVFITVALWLPSVFKNSALINYSNRGIWAILTAQTTLEPFIADQIFSFVARFAATTAGVVTGLVGWYIGSGSGPGNPYGIAVVMGVLLIPIMFWRLFTSSLIPAIMYGVTVLLVIGYSWIDSHLTLVANIGVGWPLAWRRWLLVVIGLGASTVVLFIPPKSARTAVRYANASIIFELSRLYGILISEWIVTEENEQQHEKVPDQSQYAKWPAKFRRDFTKVGAKIQLLKLRTNVARWEGSFRGRWPAKEYQRLNMVESEMLSYLAQLAGAVYHLDSVWRQRLLQRTRFLNPNFIADVMSVFSLVSRSLRTGEPVQETLPKNLLDRVLYHHSRRYQDMEEDANTDAEEQWEQIRSVDFLAYATGVTAVYKILTLLDELHLIIIKLCGEVPLRGFAEWKAIHASQNLQ